MAEFYLAGGAVVQVDDEDLEIFAEGTWRIWAVKDKPRVVKDYMARGQRYRVAAHREVVFRMRPKLLERADRVFVVPINGDFLDIRRANLEITIWKRKRGATRRPRGHTLSTPYRALARSRAQQANEPPAWSRDGQRHRVEALRGPEQGGPAHDRGAGE